MFKMKLPLGVNACLINTVEQTMIVLQFHKDTLASLHVLYIFWIWKTFIFHDCHLSRFQLSLLLVFIAEAYFYCLLRPDWCTEMWYCW